MGTSFTPLLNHVQFINHRLYLYKQKDWYPNFTEDVNLTQKISKVVLNIQGAFHSTKKSGTFERVVNGTKTSLESNSGNSGRKIKWNGNSWEKFSKISVDLAKVVLFTGNFGKWCSICHWKWKWKTPESCRPKGFILDTLITSYLLAYDWFGSNEIGKGKFPTSHPLAFNCFINDGTQ